MKLRLALSFAFVLAACAAPAPEEAGPPPVDYRQVIADSMHATLIGAPFLRDVTISEPQPGRVEFVPGWRVCVRSNLAPKGYGYFFAGGRLKSTLKDDPLCAGYSYQPWPEMEGDVARISDIAAHPVWIYRIVHDDLRRTGSHIAELPSRNETALKSRDSSARGIVQLVDDGSGPVFSLRLDRGQIDCRKDGCEIPLRFDDDPLQTVLAVHGDSADRSAVSVTDSAPLAARLQTARRLVVELPVAGNGRKQFAFDTSGLDSAQLR